MCAIDGGESYSNYRTKFVRARKPHKCDECNRAIPKGEVYRYAEGVMEGGWNSHYICSHCEVPANWLLTNCHGYVHCGIQEDIEQHTEEYPALAFGLYRFVVGMRRGWQRFNGEGLMPIPRQAKPINVAESI